MRRAALLVLLLLMVSGAVAQVDPNERTDQAPLELTGTVTALAVAGNGDGFLAGRNDPCNGPGTQPPCNSNTAADQDVWFYFTGEGFQDRSDDADPRDNNGPCQAVLGSDCQFHVVAVDISADGSRMAVASRSSDSDEGMILLMTPFQGVVQRIALAGGTAEAVQDLDLTPDGSAFAIASRVEGGFNDDSGAVRKYSWGANSATQLWRHATVFPGVSVAISEDGERVAAAAGRAIRYADDGTATVASSIDGNVVDVGMAADATHFSVAGYDTNWVALFGDSNSGATHIYSNKMLGSVTSVAISPNAEIYAAGDSTGRIRLYANRDLLPSSPSILQSTAAATSPVADMAWSADGNYLVAAVGSELRFYVPDSSGLNLGWAATLPAAISHVALSDSGDVIAAAVGSNVHVFDALRTLAVDAPTSRGVQPGETVSIAVDYENTGNRQFDVDLSADVGTWDVTLSDPSISLNPGDTRTVTFDVSVPENEPVGEVDISISHRIEGQSLVERTITIDVGQVHSWAITPTPPVSQAIEPGQTVRFTATLHNLGNAADTTTVLATMDAPGWALALSDDTASLGPGEQMDVTVDLTAPADAVELDEAVVTLRLGADGDAELKLSASVGATFGMDFVSATPATIEQGGSGTTSLVIRNTGNALDSYRMSVGSLPTGWTVTFVGGASTQLVPPIAAGQQATTVATINVPATAAPGTYQVEFSAGSLSDITAGGSKAAFVTVEEPAPQQNGTTDGGGSNKSPGLPLVAAGFTLLALAALRVHRNRQG